MPEVATEQKSATELALPWKVIVHNDPINLMSYVRQTFERVFGYPHEKAHRHMMEVHEQGRSVVWTGERERAEHYVQLLQQYLLLSTLEPAE